MHGRSFFDGRKEVRILLTMSRSLALFLLIFIASVHVVAAGGNPEEQSGAGYPRNPRGVVEAFVQTSLADAVMPAEKVKPIPNPNQERYRYYMTDAPGAFSWDCFDVGTGYEIKEVKQTNNKGTVKVTFRRLGRLCPTYFIKGKRGTPLVAAREIAKERLKKEEYNHLLFLTDDTQELTYSLKKDKGLWKIESLANPTYISVGAAINELNSQMTNYPGVRKMTPSEEEKSEIKRVIKILEGHLPK